MAYLALGTRGLGIADVSQFQRPILLGQLDLPGEATEAGRLGPEAFLPDRGRGDSLWRMKYTGTVKGGVVVLQGVTLEDGTVVQVEPLERVPTRTLGQRLKRFAGTAHGLPPDMAENHDHYLHGRPKK